MGKIASLLERWPALNQLLDQALALPPEARPAWLTTLSGLDEAQQATLRGLLGLATMPGQLIGPYRLLSLLGEGGMGSVWLAERADQQPRRKVAVKLPHLGWAAALCSRLDRERDILASLEHPNIARLYDAGVDQLGRPYLAMEFVDGKPITEFAAARGLPLRQRLELVRSVAAAVAYAHTRLVVHRDLKPSNILVTTDGDVRLLDFGIAKLMQPDADAADLTRLTGRAVTPEYSSPEQFRGEAIGTPSDVYSLAVVTYELLAGVRPYRVKDARGVPLEEAILRVQPTPLSRAVSDGGLRAQLRGDLEAILNKALKKDPAERYQTVAEFSADIGRYLSARPIRARPDGFGYRARKFLARNVLQVAAGALVLMAILTGTSIALWQAQQARLEAARADQVKEFVLSIFADADTDSGAGASTTAADLLSAAQVRVDTELRTRPDVAVELMTAIAYGLSGQGRAQQGLEIARKSVALANRELGADHPRTIAATLVHSEALIDTRDSQQAAAELTSVMPAVRKYGSAADLSVALRLRSNAEVDLGRYDEAVVDAKAAVAAIPALDTPIAKRRSEEAWGQLANALGSAQQPGAVAAARHALVLARAISAKNPSASILSTTSILGRSLLNEGSYVDALELLTPAVTEARELLGRRHPLVGYMSYFLGTAKWQLGDYEGAVTTFKSAADDVEPGSNLTSPIICSIGRVLLAARRNEPALENLERSAKLMQEAGRDAASAPVARCESSRALALARLGRLEDAERLTAQINAANPLTANELMIHKSHESELRSLQGRHAEAIALASAARAQLTSTASQLVRADANYALGRALLAAGNDAQSVEPLATALRLYRDLKLAQPNDRSVAATASALSIARDSL